MVTPASSGVHLLGIPLFFSFLYPDVILARVKFCGQTESQRAGDGMEGKTGRRSQELAGPWSAPTEGVPRGWAGGASVSICSRTASAKTKVKDKKACIIIHLSTQEGCSIIHSSLQMICVYL